jgi:hypothetical protein
MRVLSRGRNLALRDGQMFREISEQVTGNILPPGLSAEKATGKGSGGR